ncbi:MAG: DUF58 domain-containing protein [Opitutaceae bacterium]|jgi:uncharacterized protein (DUF58 family)
MTAKSAVMSAEWSGPDSPVRRWSNFKWSTLLWALVFPARTERIALTLPGVMLIALAMGIGSAAYNTANNILFIALSLMLSGLILSGLLSGLNFSGMRWRLKTAPALRAGQEATVALELRNTKIFLPTYGLWFDLKAVALPAADSAHRPDSGPASPGRGRARPSVEKRSVREILAAADQTEAQAKLYLRDRLDADEGVSLEWVFRPARRGALRLELAGVGSLFPFGFLKKTLGSDVRSEVLVWPAPVEYRSWGGALAKQPQGGERRTRAGGGTDLLALRHYEPGDSHRLIHWKASARLGKLVVRQFAEEDAEGFALWLQTPAEVWTRAEPFERLVSFAATLAEDLFRAGKLWWAVVNDEPPLAVRRASDLEEFLDQLAVVARIDQGTPGADGGRILPVKRNLITFAPDGARGVAAYVDGEKTAAA